MKKGLIGNHSDLVRVLKEADHGLAHYLIANRKILLNHELIFPDRKDSQEDCVFGPDDLGTLILEAETIYSVHVPFFKKINRTSEIVGGFEEFRSKKLDAILAVRINNIDFTHIILAKQNGIYWRFGTAYTSDKEGHFANSNIIHSVPAEDVDKICSELLMLR